MQPIFMKKRRSGREVLVRLVEPCVAYPSWWCRYGAFFSHGKAALGFDPHPPLIINTSRLSQALFLTVQNPASITQPRQLFFEKQSKRIISPSSLIA